MRHEQPDVDFVQDGQSLRWLESRAEEVGGLPGSISVELDRAKEDELEPGSRTGDESKGGQELFYTASEQVCTQE